MYNPRSLAGVSFVQIQNMSPVVEESPLVELSPTLPIIRPKLIKFTQADNKIPTPSSCDISSSNDMTDPTLIKIKSEQIESYTPNMVRGRSTFAKEALRMLRTEDKVKEADDEASEDSSQELKKFKQS